VNRGDSISDLVAPQSPELPEVKVAVALTGASRTSVTDVGRTDLGQRSSVTEGADRYAQRSQMPEDEEPAIEPA